MASVFLGWPGRRRNPGRLPPATDGLGAPAARLGKGGRGDNHRDTIRSEYNDLVEDLRICSEESGIGFAV